MRTHRIAVIPADAIYFGGVGDLDLPDDLTLWARPSTG
jgi:hypothetical protein